jgi:hypothetical protein
MEDLTILNNNIKYLEDHKNQLFHSKNIQKYLANSNTEQHVLFWKGNFTLENDFFKYCKDPETMLIALNRNDVHIMSEDIIKECILYYIMLNRLDVIQAIRTKYNFDIKEEYIIKCIELWNYEIYKYFHTDGNHNYSKELELMCGLPFITYPSSLEFFDFVLKQCMGIEGTQQRIDQQLFNTCFNLLTGAGATKKYKAEMLRIFLMNLKNNIVANVVVNVETQNYCFEISIVLYEFGLIKEMCWLHPSMSDELLIEALPLTKKWNMESFGLLLKAQKYKVLEQMIRILKPSLIELVSCIYILLNEKQWDLLLIYNDYGLKYQKEYSKIFDKIGTKTILKGPNYFSELQLLLKSYKRLR